MNDDPRYSLTTLIAYVGWAVTAALLFVGWVAWVLQDSYIGLPVMLATTACLASAVAAVAHIRCYAARLARLIRVMNGLERPDADLRELPRR